MTTELDKELLIKNAVETLKINNIEWLKCSYIMNLMYSYGFFYYDNEDANPKQIMKNGVDVGFGDYEKVNKTITDYRSYCQNDINLRWNRGTVTIYPSGEYESNFVWDEQAVQDVLISAIKKSFAALYTNAIYKINEVFLPKKEWQTATLVVEFVEGKIQSLKISIPFEGETLNFSVGIENIERTKKDTNISDYELDYALSNQENIKDKLYGSWTKVTMILHQNIFGGKFNPENYIFE